MNVKQLIALSALVFAGSAAMADDITKANESFVAQKTRAEVRADVIQARAAGQLQFANEAGTSTRTTPALAASNVSREQVRAQLRNAPKAKVSPYNEAA